MHFEPKVLLQLFELPSELQAKVLKISFHYFLGYSHLLCVNGCSEEEEDGAEKKLIWKHFEKKKTSFSSAVNRNTAQ